MASASSKSGLVQRSVASCFLFNSPSSAQPKVALFHRSRQVKTYQHRLAPISGSIEPSDPSPLAAVWREINEETTLTPSHLTLFRQGKPYSFTDTGIGRIWTVHPFAFRLKTEQDESRIQIDWEHEGWSWHDPLTVTDDEDANFGGVPFLAKSLRRVWFEMDLGVERGRVLREGLEMLQDDRESGARQLAGKALAVYRSLLAHPDGEGESVEAWWRNARFSAWHLWKNGREGMGAAILNVLVRAMGEVESEVHRDDAQGSSGNVDSGMLSSVARKLDTLASERAESIDRLWTPFHALLKSCQTQHQQEDKPQTPIRILTLSSSSTILECLSRASANSSIPPLDIRILESRPLFEGVTQASKLTQQLHLSPSSSPSSASASTISLFSDASSAQASRDIDLLLLGADQIKPDGSISNKTGSLPAVLAAKHVAPNAKIVVLAEDEKILPFSSSYSSSSSPSSSSPRLKQLEEEENASSEMSDTWSKTGSQDLTSATDRITTLMNKGDADAPQVNIRNVYFEWVPADLIDVYIHDAGQMDVAGIGARAEELKQEAEKFFAEA